ncbi:MAG: TIGR04283 family arsenosugar biosynthesis glycosyltransferase [Pseudomonadales bacterium]|nr:TIGR04283 family arsenosugar biosynthesis glycosyltransferase [Pseudomonadales bacterium]
MIKNNNIPSLSIIVPMLNEEENMPALLQHLLAWKRKGCEVLLVDGGSDDQSAALADAIGFTVLTTKRGRAFQMNAGAKVAKADVFLFLHADTQLPENADDIVLRALRSKKNCWGRFDVNIRGAKDMLKVVAWFMNYRSRLTGIATGDQAIFVRRESFEKAGGFPEQALMEDIELSACLKKQSPPYCVKQKVSTSGRRWETYGIWRTICLMWRLRLFYWFGMPAEKLAELYR